MIAPVRASPLTTFNQPTTSLAPSPSATATAVDTSSESSRDGSFQVLADGTQDLAALVGIFATNSVERYAFDYNKGHLSSAVAMLSLLGLLGYVRALVKLGIGPEACENAGFDTRALRPIFGVPDADRLPANEVYALHYIERQENASEITWRLVRRTKHTLDSSAWGQENSLTSQQPDWHEQDFVIEECVLYSPGQVRSLSGLSFKIYQYLGFKLFRSSLGDLLVLIISLICVGLTSCLVIPLRGTSRPTWSLYVATVGLFTPIVITSLAWAWVYAQEQLPLGRSDWMRGSHSNTHFAYICLGHGYIILNVRAVEGHLRSGIRIASLIAALSAIAGYVCQYIEVRRMSSRNSGIWLGTQGLLALIRVAIWIANPTFDDIKFGGPIYSHSPNLSERQLGLIWLSRVARGGLMWLSRAQGARYLGSDTAFRMPVWAAEGLDPAGTYLHEQIVMAFSTYCKRQNPQIDLLAQLQNAKEHWDMPKRLFMAWVNLHSHPNEPLPDNWYDYGARIIMDNEGKCHVLPFWRVEMITDHSVYEVKVFGDFDDGAATVLNYARSSQREGTTEEITIRGWQTHVFFDANDHEIEEPFSGLELLERIFDRGTWGRFRLPFDKSAIREQPLKIMDSVWKDLIHILGNAAHWTGQQLPDIFLEEKEPKHPTHTDNSADFNDNAPKTSGLRQRRQSY